MKTKDILIWFCTTLIAVKLTYMYTNKPGVLFVGQREWVKDLFTFQKLQIMDPEQALKDLGITQHNVRFTSTLCVDESQIETKTAEKIYQLIKG